jgi:PAS domain S-box-containing protein
MRRRIPIARKILLVYAATVGPLGLVALFVFFAWFGVSTQQLLQDRLGAARLTATSLQLIVQNVATASSFVGREIIENRLPQERGNALLVQVVDELPLRDASLVTTAGIVTYSSDPALLGRSFAANPAVVRAFEQTAPAVAPSESASGGAVFCVAEPIRVSGIEMIALSRVDVDRLRLRLPQRGAMGGTNIVDSSGRVVFESEYPQMARVRQYWGSVPFVRQALRGKESSTVDFAFPGDRHRRIAAAVPITGWGWEAGASIDFGQAEAPFRVSVAKAIGISLIIVFVGIALGFTATRSMLDGLRKLTTQSELLGRGDLSELPPAETGDEIEDVSRTLDTARADLASYVSGLAALAATARELSESLAIGDVRDAIVNGAKQLFGARSVWVFRYSPESGALETYLWYSDTPGPPPGVRIRPGESVAGKAFAEGKMVIVPDIRSVPDFAAPEIAAIHGITSMVDLPLMAHDNPYGVLGMHVPALGRWTSGGRETALLEAFTSQVSASLENARLYEELQRTAERLRSTLEELRTLIVSAPTAIIALDPGGRVLAWNPAAERIFGYSADEVVGHMLPTVPEEEWASFEEINRRTASGETLSDVRAQRRTKDGRLLDCSIASAPLYDARGRYRGSTAIVQDITERMRAERRLRDSEAKFRAVVEQSKDGITMVERGDHVVLYNAAMERITGYSMEEVNERGGWLEAVFEEEHERERVVVLARRMARGEIEWAEARIRRKDGMRRWVTFSLTRVTVERAEYTLGIVTDIEERKRFEHEREKGRELAASLNEINTAINALLDFDEIMRPVLSMASDALHMNAGLVLLAESGHWVPRFVHNLPPSILGRRISDEDAPFAARASTSREPHAVPDTATEAACAGFVCGLGIRAVVAVPMVLRGEVAGVLAFASLTGPCQLDSLDLDFVAKVGAAVSTALENTRLYDEERVIADTLQEAILAMPQHVPGIRFGCLYRSGAAASQVGGDFYDLFELEHDLIGIVVGDVSGKGLPAASLTSLAKNTVRAYAYGGDPPREALRKTNDIVYQSVSEATFLTMVFAVLDTRTGLLSYTNAGHPAGLVLRRSGAVDELPANAMLLGAFPRVVFGEAATRLEPGDILLLFTDGISEARRGHDLFGEERVREWLADFGPGVPPEDLPAALLEHVSAFAAGQLTDDVAVLALSPTDARDTERG